MFSSIITKTTAKILFLIGLISSSILIFRGSNVPGGGFISAVLTIDLFLFFSFSQNIFISEKNILSVLSIGLYLVFFIQVLSIFLFGNFFVDYLIFSSKIINISSLLLFDIGIYLIVFSCLSLIAFELNLQ